MHPTSGSVFVAQRWVVPIDAWYELVGLIRIVWRGLQGGDDVQRGIDECLARVIGAGAKECGMTTLAISVTGAHPSLQTTAPGITFRLRIEELSGARIHTATLRCRVQIAARSRRYTKEEQRRLYELFGSTSQWDRTLHSV